MLVGGKAKIVQKTQWGIHKVGWQKNNNRELEERKNKGGDSGNTVGRQPLLQLKDRCRRSYPIIPSPCQHHKGTQPHAVAGDTSMAHHNTARMQTHTFTPQVFSVCACPCLLSSKISLKICLFSFTRRRKLCCYRCMSALHLWHHFTGAIKKWHQHPPLVYRDVVLDFPASLLFVLQMER